MLETAYQWTYNYFLHSSKCENYYLAGNSAKSEKHLLSENFEMFFWPEFFILKDEPILAKHKKITTFLQFLYVHLSKLWHVQVGCMFLLLGIWSWPCAKPANKTLANTTEQRLDECLGKQALPVLWLPCEEAWARVLDAGDTWHSCLHLCNDQPNMWRRPSSTNYAQPICYLTAAMEVNPGYTWRRTAQLGAAIWSTHSIAS